MLRVALEFNFHDLGSNNTWHVDALRLEELQQWVVASQKATALWKLTQQYSDHKMRKTII